MMDKTFDAPPPYSSPAPQLATPMGRPPTSNYSGGIFQRVRSGVDRLMWGKPSPWKAYSVWGTSQRYQAPGTQGQLYQSSGTPGEVIQMSGTPQQVYQAQGLPGQSYQPLGTPGQFSQAPGAHGQVFQGQGVPAQTVPGPAVTGQPIQLSTGAAGVTVYNVQPPKDYLMMSVLVCLLFGCWPISAVAIFFSCKAMEAKMHRDYELATTYGRSARKFNIVSVITASVIAAIALIVGIVFLILQFRGINYL